MDTIKTYIFLNKEGIVANIINIDENQLELYVKLFEEVSLFTGKVPLNVSYQHRIIEGELVYDEQIEDILGKVAAPQKNELEIIVERQQADIDYLLMFMEE